MGLQPGDPHYRAYVGPPEKYDLVAAMQFNLLTFLGLREHHYLLDIGCGSLRAGRLFITYLLPGRYFGIEPNAWLIQEGIRHEVGNDLIRMKQPTFSHDSNFTLTIFNREFDFLLAHSIFSHAAEHQIRRCLSEARKVMKPTSLFAATFVQGETNYEGQNWVYPECVTYTLEHMQRLAREHGLNCTPIRWPHPNNQTWLILTRTDFPHAIPTLDVADYLDLQRQLRQCREHLARIKNHPVIKLGLKIRRVLRKI